MLDGELVGGQSDDDATAAPGPDGAGHGLDGDASTMHLGDAPGEGEAQPQPTGRARRACPIPPVERREDTLALGSRNPRPVVGHAQSHLVAHALRAERDWRGPVLGRVLDEIPDGAPQECPVCCERHGQAVHDVDRRSLEQGVVTGALGDVHQDASRVERVQAHGEAGLVQTGGRQDVFDQPIEVGEIGFHAAQPRLARDIRRQQLERHTDTRQRRPELVRHVGEQLRSPLTRIRVALELLPPDVASEARLRGVEADLADLDRLIEDILTTARLDEAGLPMRLDALDARRVLMDVAERARHDPLLEGTPVHVVDGLPVSLAADGALLRRAVWNLVENAAKYGAPPITLSAERVGDQVALSVADDGPGIPAAERERVFTPFYRGDRARASGPARGLGLGLTLARRVAEVHGGRIAIEAVSGAGGAERGCRVVITLPADQLTV